jgi:hypothetical protein
MSKTSSSKKFVTFFVVFINLISKAQAHKAHGGAMTDRTHKAGACGKPPSTSPLLVASSSPHR